MRTEIHHDETKKTWLPFVFMENFQTLKKTMR